ncbi:MAG: gamma-glutamyl-gamma-aminobutyrate hydrolase family protein [Bacillota bacterium]
MTAIIGISCGFNNVKEENIILHNSYIETIKKAGGIPVLLPPHLEEQNLKIFKEKLDGVLLSGGGDIDPQVFNQEPEYNMRRIDPVRDKFELKLTEWLLQTDIPLLAICRGIQILNIVCGGSIIQHLESPCIKHNQNAPRWYPTHKISLKKGSWLEKIYEKNEIKVNSFHHQAIDKLGEDLDITARTDDGIIEGVEYREHPFAVGVQWHPERMYDNSYEQKLLFEQFIKMCS